MEAHNVWQSNELLVSSHVLGLSKLSHIKIITPAITPMEISLR